MLMQVGPVLEAMEDILAALLRSLDGRVYVAVGRGLWDFTSKDIYDYVDSLQEGKENKVCDTVHCCTLVPIVAQTVASVHTEQCLAPCMCDAAAACWCPSTHAVPSLSASCILPHASCKVATKYDTHGTYREHGVAGQMRPLP